MQTIVPCSRGGAGRTGKALTRHGEALQLGWLGTGRMGAAMVRRLLANGCDVTVYNRTAAKAAPLVELGAKAAGSCQELAGCDIVFTAVGTPADLVSALTGPGGLISGSASPKIVVDTSTVSADASAIVRERLGERGTALLAAPVMGNPKVVEVGRMTAAVSGPRDAFDTAQPYLNMLGRGVTYVGDGELARVVKLCHNLFLGVVAASMAEITILAQASGISREAFLACLNNSVVGSQFTQYKTPAYVNLDFEATFTARLLRKDFDLGLAAARECEVPMPVAAVVHQLIQSLVSRGYGDVDFAALIEQEAQLAGLTLESEHADVSDGLGPPGPARSLSGASTRPRQPAQCLSATVRPSPSGIMTSSTRSSAAAWSFIARTAMTDGLSLPASSTRPWENVLSTMITPPLRTRGTTSAQYLG